MAMPDLESVTARLDAETVTLLGDTITYVGLPAPIKAFVDHSEGRHDFGYSAATVQDMRLQVRVSDVPARPDATNRIQLPKIPGKTYAPRDVQLSEGGTFWDFGLKEVPGG